MTQQLQQVFERVSGLSPEIQNELAASWMAELEDELIWQKQLGESQDVLSGLAKSALANHAKGKTQEKGWDEL
ncbi:MAG: hypothetical protein HN351_05930 [Deltaproteobacteria bacterium]|jgi:hypothetical protein|nr:hypothetical protein [Deltaproteobacteria bacterium]